jgi:hypothetical protein
VIWIVVILLVAVIAGLIAAAQIAEPFDEADARAAVRYHEARSKLRAAQTKAELRAVGARMRRELDEELRVLDRKRGRR